MTLICMLFALLIERLAVRSAPWQLLTYLEPYLRWSQQGPLARLQQHSYGVFVWWLLPAALLALLLASVDFWLVTLLVNTLVLLVCMGCWHYRQLYKQYLNAAARSDHEAAFLVMQQLSQQAGIQNPDLSYGQRLVWLNFRYYAAVLFWFALLGVFGALAYAMLRQLAEPKTFASELPQQSDAPVEAPVHAAEPATSNDSAAVDATGAKDAAISPGVAAAPVQTQAELYVSTVARDLLHLADWLPVRLFSLGFALVGHFSKASSKLLGYVFDVSAPAEDVLTQVAQVAEPITVEPTELLQESGSLLQLAKRNILFFLALIAILTLSGWVS